jgi:hypothetical protein
VAALRASTMKMVYTTLCKWKKALVTEEDFIHHHKILGLLCLISFAFRISNVFNDMGFKDLPEWTIPTLTLHWMLNASSLQFKIPEKRIKDGGRIWPQYRLHAFIFTTRSVILMALYWYEQQHKLEPNYDVNLVVALLTMAAADYVTFASGDKNRSNSVRDMRMPGWLKFSFSAAQFNATTGIVFGLRSYSIPFYILFVVQTTPFVATLRRKGVFTSDIGGAVVYGLFLICGFLTQVIQYSQAGGERMHLFVRCITLLAATLRFSLLPSTFWLIQNKYVIWTLMYLIIRHVRPFIGQLDVSQLRMILAALFASFAFSGYIKIKSGYYSSNGSTKTAERAQ